MYDICGNCFIFISKFVSSGSQIETAGTQCVQHVGTKIVHPRSPGTDTNAVHHEISTCPVRKTGCTKLNLCAVFNGHPLTSRYGGTGLVFLFFR